MYVHTRLPQPQQDASRGKPLAFRLLLSPIYGFTPLPASSATSLPPTKNVQSTTYHAFPRPSSSTSGVLLLVTEGGAPRVVLLTGACVPGAGSAVRRPVLGASSSPPLLALQTEGCVFGRVCALSGGL